jgi:hypothetical protein
VYLGLRVNSSAWLKSKPYGLLLEHLEIRPRLSKELQSAKHNNNVGYGPSYINAVNSMRNSAYGARPGLREVHHNAEMEDVYAYGS